ncbi:hypothetical protein M440DRAFT_1459999 [Trichoderma longibrachiatum ATCC 18648]|uniref:Uncharacterized protein n=1 Tax=Trichoderma longibrachiatum ATCC 18648 TaxID=983965 RepID=A0A2T4CE84_TRILO|nr:hypothetical protein M440DRAFT_1459999 [Trichoderma longibrachiatum ATCC 18648]
MQRAQRGVEANLPDAKGMLNDATVELNNKVSQAPGHALANSSPDTSTMTDAHHAHPVTFVARRAPREERKMTETGRPDACGYRARSEFSMVIMGLRSFLRFLMLPEPLDVGGRVSFLVQEEKKKKKKRERKKQAEREAKGESEPPSREARRGECGETERRGGGKSRCDKDEAELVQQRYVWLLFIGLSYLREVAAGSDGKKANGNYTFQPLTDPERFMHAKHVVIASARNKPSNLGRVAAAQYKTNQEASRSVHHQPSSALMEHQAMSSVNDAGKISTRIDSFEP